jgi:O-antigen/teichoic acid export membrane protein
VSAPGDPFLALSERSFMTGSVPSGRRNLLTNAVVNWAGFAVNLVVAFFLFPFLVHGLGKSRYGVWWLVESVLAYLMLFDLGVAASVVRYVARFEAVRDQDNLNRVFSTSICIFAAAGGFILILSLAVAFLGMGFLDMPPEMLDESRWLLVLLGFNLAVGLPLNVFPCVLDGLGRFPAKTLIRTAALLVRSVLFVVVIRAGGGLIELGLVITGCNLAENLALAVAAWRYLPGLRFSLRLADWATFRTIRGYSLAAFLTMLAGRISCQTDAVVIYAFLTPAAITVFAVAMRLIEYGKSSLRALTTVLTPAISALEARGDSRAIRDVLINSSRYVLWLILPLQLGLLLLGKPFLSLWMGRDYAEQSFPTLVLLALPLALSLSQSVSARILYGIGRLRWFACLSLAEALANLLLSVALVIPLGVEGVALGTAIPSAVASVVLAVYVCRKLGVGVGEYVRRSCLLPTVLAGGLAAGWGVVAAWVPLVSWGRLLATGMGGVACYLMAALLVEFGPQAILGRLRGTVQRLDGKPGADPAPALAARMDEPDPALPVGVENTAA